MESPERVSQIAVVRATRDELDLGLRMVESLVRIGEPAAAARLVGELRRTTRVALTPQTHRSRTTWLRRRAVTIGCAAAVSAAGALSAAAVVSPEKRDARPVQRIEPSTSVPSGTSGSRGRQSVEAPSTSRTGVRTPADAAGNVPSAPSTTTTVAPTPAPGDGGLISKLPIEPPSPQLRAPETPVGELQR